MSYQCRQRARERLHSPISEFSGDSLEGLRLPKVSAQMFLGGVDRPPRGSNVAVRLPRSTERTPSHSVAVGSRLTGGYSAQAVTWSCFRSRNSRSASHISTSLLRSTLLIFESCSDRAFEFVSAQFTVYVPPELDCFEIQDQFVCGESVMW
jgi:hypothetical protein